MIDIAVSITVSLWMGILFSVLTSHTLGAMQQSGYKNGTFLKWLSRKENMLFNRLSVLALCLALTTAVASLCFSFLGTKLALLISAIPYVALLLAFRYADGKYALKVRAVYTGRLVRLFVAQFVLLAGVTFGFINLLHCLAELNGSQIYALVAYVPFAVMPMLLPFLLCLANLICSPFEKARNRKFVKRAGQVLNETEIIRVGVVGSYGKTSVKNILKTILSEKYTVVETPESYNTPIGIAKTVTSEKFAGKQVFIAEMGARKAGDIAELCKTVKPDYAIFTGVCAQHIETFGSVENVFKEKSEILRCGAKKVVCGGSLRDRVTETDGVAFAAPVEKLVLSAMKTEFALSFGGEEIPVSVRLLGKAAAENVALAATLAYAMGLSAEEIGRGIAKLEPIPHRLQLLESEGVYVLDDGYNGNPEGAKEALAALGRFEGRKCVVTPGLVECGVLEEELNGDLGEQLARLRADKVILVGDTLVGAVKRGYERAGGEAEALEVAHDLSAAQALLAQWTLPGDAVLFLNDLPDVY